MRRSIPLLAGILLASCSHDWGNGSIPSLSFAGSRQLPPPSATEKVLYSFSAPDGLWPLSGLTQLNGTLYGTTYGGGTATGRCSKGCGTVFSVTTGGSENVLHDFGGIPDGAIPEAPLTEVNGQLYGTTFYGGKSVSDSCTAGLGCGTVFSVDTSGQHEKVLYRFGGGTDGSNPQGGLLLNRGVLYGTTTGGLNGRLCAGQRSASGVTYGTLFKIAPNGSGYHVLHSFAGTPNDGACPIGSLIEFGGALYGVTFDGGANNVGTVFTISKNGTERVLHSFTTSDGDYPVGVVPYNGKLYGTASANGAYNRGSLFSMSSDGKNFRTLYSFVGFRKKDGSTPYAPPIEFNGLLFGTTQHGGADGVGTVYQMYDLTSLHPKECVMHSFLHPPADGTLPVAPLIAYKGQLYGTTVIGGKLAKYTKTHGLGTVFEIEPSPAGCGSR